MHKWRRQCDERRDERILVPIAYRFATTAAGGYPRCMRCSLRRIMFELWGKYSKKKINTFASIFPISSSKYVLIVLLDEPKLSETYIYEYNDGKKRKIIGTPFNTAGWTSVEVAKNIIEKIGPILAIKY